ncbi:MAG: lactonase family protein [Phycisphaerae bacterium]
MFAPSLEWITPALLSILLIPLVFPTRAAGAAPATSPATAPAKPVLIYVGTYTSPEEKGIELLRLDPISGTLTPLGLAAEIPSPSFLTLSPDRKYLFAVSEAPHGPARHGLAAGFSIEPGTGKLTPLNTTDSTGTDPCHLTLDSAGRHLFVANYSSGSIAVLPVDVTGHLGAPTATIQHPTPAHPPTARQKGPHAHGVSFDPTQRLLLVPDLGLDQVLLYDYHAPQGTLTAATPPAITLPPGTGPRHVAFDPTGRFLYVIGELASTITSFAYDSALPAHFRTIQSISLLPSGTTQSNSAAEIVVHPSGRFLFASNRGHDSIAVFTRDATTGRLTAAGHFPTHGKTPRHFMIDPTGTLLLVANQDSNNITVFRIDPVSGVLTYTGVEAKIHAPVCLLPWAPFE